MPKGEGYQYQLMEQREYAKKRLKEDDASGTMSSEEKKRRRALFNRVVARADVGAGPSRKDVNKQGEKGGRMEALSELIKGARNIARMPSKGSENLESVKDTSRSKNAPPSRKKGKRMGTVYSN